MNLGLFVQAGRAMVRVAGTRRAGWMVPVCGVLALPVQALTEADWLRCAARPAADARLACYDALAASLRPAAGSLPTPTPSPPVAAASAQAAQVARFGAPDPAPKQELDAIESQILGRIEGWGPGEVFQLTNGQRWTVSDGSSAVMDLKDPKVVIRRAAMGTFRIEFEGSNQTARVKRMP